MRSMVSTHARGSRSPGRIVRAGALIAATVAIAGGLAACSGDGGGDASGSDKTLTLYEGSAPPTLNPMMQSSRQVTNNLAYDSLLIQTDTTTYTPELAESVAYVGDGNKEIEIKLRDNVKFSDGTSLTAEGLQSFIEATIAASNVSTDSFPLESFASPDASTLDITFSTAFPYAETWFAQAGLFGSPVSSEKLTADDLGTATYGAGPYMLDASQTTSGTTYTFVKNPNFFKPEAQQWSQVVVKIIGDNAARLQSVEAGQYSLEQGSTADNDTATAAGLQLVTNPATSIYGMILLDRTGTLVPALGNEKVRQALNYAMDRASYATALGGTPYEQVGAEGYVGHYDGDVYSYDVAKAKQLLAEAGYADGFTLPILYESTDPLSSSVVQIITPALEAIGVTVQLTGAPSIQEYGQQTDSGQFPAAVQQMQGGKFTLTTSRIFAPGGLFNPLGSTWPTDSFQQQYEDASALSGDAADAAWADLGKYITQNAWLVDVVGLPSTYYATKDLTVPPAFGVYPDPVLMTPAA